MRHSPSYLLEDPDEIKRLIRENPWATIVSGTASGFLASHYPVVLEEDAGDFVPTWNHVTAHLYGTPEILEDEENFRVLDDLVDHFERRMPHPTTLDIDEPSARRIARGTVGIRLVVTRFDARLKLSQNKPPEVVDRIIDQLENGTEYANPALAVEMRRVRATPTESGTAG